MDIKTHCPECKAEFLTELEEPVLTELGLQRKPSETDAKLTDVARLQEDTARLGEEVANLKDEIARLESEEHSQEVITHWLNNLESADPEAKVRLGEKLGLAKLFKEAEVAEEKEPEPVAEKPEVVYADPQDDDYVKVPGIPVYLLSKKA